MTVKDWLEDAATQLAEVNIPSSRLDAELLLAYHLNVDRSWLIAHSSDLLAPDTVRELLSRRLRHEPIAYIVQRKEFFGRSFYVDEHVLIPRPESEVIVSYLKQLQPQGRLVDVGTGSGCLAISIALECPNLSVSAVDISPQALAVATRNAKELHAAVAFKKDYLLTAATQQVDYIVANLPYVDRSWQRSLDTDFEPQLALFAESHGLELIYKLLPQAQARLTVKGLLVLEADPRQFTTLQQQAARQGFELIHTDGFMQVYQKR
ncbi:MAG TPA: peptide chain release factor N(5)-glutamine methyltransferase [Candidatus Saccharimonadales bacterium]